MDTIMKALQELKDMIQRNTQNQQNFELECNSLDSNFGKFVLDNNKNLQIMENLTDKVKNSISSSQENHNTLQDK